MSTKKRQHNACVSRHKMDCVGHVQKRLGKHLRTLHKAGGKLFDGKSVKGSSGRLMEGVIDRLQKYYGNAIRNNVDSDAKIALTKAPGLAIDGIF